MRMCCALTAAVVQAASPALPRLSVIGPRGASDPIAELALKEAQRYVGAIAGRRPSLQKVDLFSEKDLPSDFDEAIFITTRDHFAMQSSFSRWDSAHSTAVAKLSHPDSHCIHTIQVPSTNSSVRRAIVCTGSTSQASLYCVYSLLEALGARFYLHEDVLPRTNPSFSLPTLHRIITPRFSVRGLQPFHDFPMGPDLWQPEFWRALSTQMAKMKMNFFGFHTYPTGPNPGKIAEPLVWIGSSAGYNHSDGSVLASLPHAYDTSWYQTMDFWTEGEPGHTRGNVGGEQSIPTSSYCCGAQQAFGRDCYGSAAQAAICYPSTPAESASVFNNAAELIRGAFEWSSTFAGVQGCVGIEFPLTLPPGLGASGVTIAEAYEGIFGRIVAAQIPISTFWLWTNEGVENHGDGRGKAQSDPMWQALVQEIGVAQAALEKVGANFTLGTNGWCLGPGDNASFFDQEIPDRSFKISAINGALGWLPPDPAYARMDGSRSWVIPWMEDDLSLASEELWVNRTIDHANQAHNYGADGLLGLMWRTWETAPTIAALAQQGWDVDVDVGAEEDGENEAASAAAAATATATDTAVSPDLAFYSDWCGANFGASTASMCAALFLSVDSFSSLHKPGTGVTPKGAKLPRNGQACCGGPMTPVLVPEADLLNVTGFEAWAKEVEGGADTTAEQLERATHWVRLFQYHRLTQLVSNSSAALSALAAAHTQPDASALDTTLALEMVALLSAQYSDMICTLLEFTTTPGEMGMLAAHEGANWPSKFNASITAIVKASGYRPPPAPPRSCKADLSRAQCWSDSNTARTFPDAAWISGATSHESCAVACYEKAQQEKNNISLAAVEYGVACFCGTAWPDSKVPPRPHLLPLSSCDKMKCSANPLESCGAAGVMLIYPFSCSAPAPTPPTPAPPAITPAQVRALMPSKNYTGAPRIYRTAVRTIVSKLEQTFKIEVVVLSRTPPTEVTLFYAPAASTSASATVPARVKMLRNVDPRTGSAHPLAQVYSTAVPNPGEDFEYHVEANFEAHTSLQSPTASNQTVVVV